MIDSFADTHWMKLALKEAHNAYRIGEVPVGCVIVRDDQIVGRGFNQTEKLNDPTAHAEILAISAAAETLGDWRLEGSVMYCTLEPCAMCAGAAVLARIEKIVYGAPDPRFGACESLYSIPTDARLNHRIALVSGVLADEISDMMRTFFQEIRKQKGKVN